MHYEETMIMMEEFKKAKFSEDQTRVILKAVESAQKDGLENLATKEDIANVKQNISNVRQEISDVKVELKQDIHNLELKVSDLRSELKDEITELKIILNRVDDNISLVKWFALGILLPVIAATFKFLIFPMFSS